LRLSNPSVLVPRTPPPAERDYPARRGQPGRSFGGQGGNMVIFERIEKGADTLLRSFRLCRTQTADRRGCGMIYAHVMIYEMMVDKIARTDGFPEPGRLGYRSDAERYKLNWCFPSVISLRSFPASCCKYAGSGRDYGSTSRPTLQL
jgi:hypothetical protein